MHKNDAAIMKMQNKRKNTLATLLFADSPKRLFVFAVSVSSFRVLFLPAIMYSALTSAAIKFVNRQVQATMIPVHTKKLKI
jgi:hypothetical protein